MQNSGGEKKKTTQFCQDFLCGELSLESVEKDWL